MFTSMFDNIIAESYFGEHAGGDLATVTSSSSTTIEKEEHGSIHDDSSEEAGDMELEFADDGNLISDNQVMIVQIIITL